MIEIAHMALYWLLRRITRGKNKIPSSILKAIALGETVLNKRCRNGPLHIPMILFEAVVIGERVNAGGKAIRIKVF